MEVYRKMATNPKFKARRGVEIRKCLRKKKKKTLNWSGRMSRNLTGK